MPTTGEFDFPLGEVCGLRGVHFRRDDLQIVEAGGEFRNDGARQDVFERNLVAGMLAAGDGRRSALAELGEPRGG